VAAVSSARRLTVCASRTDIIVVGLLRDDEDKAHRRCLVYRLNQASLLHRLSVDRLTMHPTSITRCVAEIAFLSTHPRGLQGLAKRLSLGCPIFSYY